jgi:hypothetical protein
MAFYLAFWSFATWLIDFYFLSRHRETFVYFTLPLVTWWCSDGGADNFTANRFRVTCKIAPRIRGDCMANYYYYLLDSRQFYCHGGEFSIGMRRDCFYGAILKGHRNLIIQFKSPASASFTWQPDTQLK